jgi:6-phosphogluconolactonase
MTLQTRSLYFLVSFFIFSILHSQEKVAEKKDYIFLYVGTYTEGKPDKGIYIYRFDPSNSSVQQIATAKYVINPSFITVSANGKYIYACTETKMKKAGSVSAFMLDRKSNQLKFLNKQNSLGENPVYLSLSRSEKWLVNANYTGGGVSVYPININHELDDAVQVIQFKDSSIIKDRQSSSHPHAAVFSPRSDHVYISDLGADKIRLYRFDTTNISPLQKTEPQFIRTTPGSGPRHLAFHPDGKYLYCVEEISEAVSVYTLNDGRPEFIHRVSTRDSTPHISHGSADIHVSPDGKFLYVSNRGDKNTITVYSLSETGIPEIVAYQPTLGEHPRNFCIDPTGNFLFVANSGSNAVVIFKRDQKTGLLEETGTTINIPRPACLQVRIMKE